MSETIVADRPAASKPAVSKAKPKQEITKTVAVTIPAELADRAASFVKFRGQAGKDHYDDDLTAAVTKAINELFESDAAFLKYQGGR